MVQSEMENIVKSMAKDYEGSEGFVEFEYEDLKLYLISDVKHDRMRIMSPITRYEKLSEGEVHDVLAANFSTALDARYAVSDGILFV